MDSEITERKLKAIVFADVVGFSRLMERNEAGAFERLRKLREGIIGPELQKFAGRLIKTTGDGFLAEFDSSTASVKCGIAIQRQTIALESEISQEDRIRFRIGINLGDIIVDGQDVAGDDVNIASRLESLSPPEGICISASVREQLREDLGVTVEDLGERQLKNISRPVHAFTLLLSERTSALAALNVASAVPGFGGRSAIAVLPFDNMSNDPEQQYFADGIAEDILTRLAMWRWIPVIARNSSFVFRGKSVDIREAGKTLGARYILEGSVRKAGDRVRVTGQLIDSETGSHLWAERYDRASGDIFDIQDEITNAIVTALEPVLGKAERAKSLQKNTRDLGAWDLYMRALWHVSQFTKEHFHQAYKLCHEAADLDKDFARPLAITAKVMMTEVIYGWADNPVNSIIESFQLAKEAVNRDPYDSLAQAALSFQYAMLGEFDPAYEHATKAIEFNPSYPLGYESSAFTHMLDGQAGKAVSELETAYRLDPTDDVQVPVLLTMLSLAYYLCHDYEKAREVAQRATDVPHPIPNAYRSLASALGQLNRIDEGKLALQKFLEMSPNFNAETAKLIYRFKDESDFEHYLAGMQKLGWSGDATLGTTLKVAIARGLMKYRTGI